MKDHEANSANAAKLDIIRLIVLSRAWMAVGEGEEVVIRILTWNRREVREKERE